VAAVERLAAAESLDGVVQVVRDTARAICGADGVTFVLRDQDRCHYIEEDAITPLWKGRRFPMSACISGWCMLNDQMAAIPDIYQDRRIPHDAYRPTFVKSLVMTPVKVREPVAAIGAYWAEVREFDEGELALLEGLARSTAAAIGAVLAREALVENEARLGQALSELAHAGRLSEMSKMSSALAHELNQPLTAADNYLGAARRMLAGEDPVAALERVGQAVDKADAQVIRAAQIIRRLRGFIGKGEAQRAVEDVRGLVQEAAEIALVDPRHKAFHLRLELARRLAPVMVDKVQVQQVLLNLIRNACEAMDGQDGAAVTVSAAAAPAAAGDDEHGMVEVRVADQGPGLSHEMAARLFQPFVTTKAEGMGVGLSLCRDIVEAHGGRIRAENGPDGGAVFSFTLPVAM
jgi:two-component system sensor kinase FixL